jgi:hypothetical protein
VSHCLRERKTALTYTVRVKFGCLPCSLDQPGRSDQMCSGSLVFRRKETAIKQLSFLYQLGNEGSIFCTELTAGQNDIHSCALMYIDILLH